MFLFCSMSSTIPLPVTDRFALIIEDLLNAVAARRRFGLSGLLIIAIWSRLRRIAARFAVLATGIRIGKAPAPRRRVSRPASSRPKSPLPIWLRLPNGFAWLVRLVPHEAADFGSQLTHLLTDPEMIALVSAHPETGRVLRPLCRMLGVATPPLLRLARPSPAAPPPSPEPPATPPPPTIPLSELPAPILARTVAVVVANSEKSE